MKITSADQLRDGMMVRCKIKGVPIPVATVAIDSYGAYICHDNLDNKTHGAPSLEDRRGHKYAWLFLYPDGYVTDLETIGKITTKPYKKPPLGIMPQWLWREQRMWDLIACLARYKEAEEGINIEWLRELGARIEDVLQSKQLGDQHGR